MFPFIFAPTSFTQSKGNFYNPKSQSCPQSGLAKQMLHDFKKKKKVM